MEGPLWVGELRIHCRAEGYIHENTSGDYAFHASFDDIIMRYSGCNQESQRGTISRDWSNWKARSLGSSRSMITSEIKSECEKSLR